MLSFDVEVIDLGPASRSNRNQYSDRPSEEPAFEVARPIVRRSFLFLRVTIASDATTHCVSVTSGRRFFRSSVVSLEIDAPGIAIVWIVLEVYSV